MLSKEHYIKVWLSQIHSAPAVDNNRSMRFALGNISMVNVMHF